MFSCTPLANERCGGEHALRKEEHGEVTERRERKATKGKSRCSYLILRTPLGLIRSHSTSNHTPEATNPTPRTPPSTCKVQVQARS